MPGCTRRTHDAVAATLLVKVHTEAAEARDAVREVDLPVLGELLGSLRGHELGHDALELAGRAGLSGDDASRCPSTLM